jgi:dipeptidyl aminopeptidase/acylaminoacyl peptidase
VIFAAADGLTLHGQLFLPPGKHPGRAPAVIYFHGGPERQALLGWHPMRPYSYLYAMNQHLASEGYVVLSVNYRGGEGYGLDFREAAHVGPMGASELNDIIGAARFLDGRADVDPKRIGLWGGSYGGLMTALGLSRTPELFAVGVDYAGVHDWPTFAAFHGISGLPPEVSQAMYASSVVGDLSKWKAPVLLVHADDDHDVPFSQTVELVQALRKHGVDVQQLVLPNENHDLMRKDSWLRFLHATDEFLSAHLDPVNQGR